jgi:hypothetical protein
MPIFVNLPDGSRASFPDGTTPDVMKAAIQKKFPPSGPPAGATPGSRGYADWAAAQARAGKPLPQVSPTPPEANHSLLDQISAGTTAAANAVPIAGPTLLKGLETMRGAIQHMTPEAVHAETIATEEANPTAATTGWVAGNVVPLVAAGGLPGLGRVLGTTGGLMSRIGFGGLSGAAISGVDAKARGKSDNEAVQDAMFGGAFGAALPAVASGARRLLSPMRPNAAQTAAARVMDQEGVTLTAGQRTGSNKLKYIESELGGGAADAIQERQGREFTRAVLRRAGVDADSVEPQVIDGALTGLGNEFDRLAANNTMIPDARLSRDLGRTVQEYNSLVPASQRAPIVQGIITDFNRTVLANGGQFDGAAYQALRSRLDKAARSVIASDPHLSQALSDMRNALDASMERSIATHNPGDLGAWRQVRRYYRNMLVIEKAATGAGGATAGGVLSPAQLRNAAITQNRRAFARGHSDFTDLANAAVKTLAPLPQSGTAPRLGARAFGAIPAAIGAAMGAPGGIPGAVAGAVAGAALPAAVGRVVLSAPGRALLGNQAFAGPAGRALIAPALPGILAEQKREPLMITVRGSR